MSLNYNMDKLEELVDQLPLPEGLDINDNRKIQRLVRRVNKGALRLDTEVSSLRKETEEMKSTLKVIRFAMKE